MLSIVAAEDVRKRRPVTAAAAAAAAAAAVQVPARGLRNRTLATKAMLNLKRNKKARNITLEVKL